MLKQSHLYALEKSELLDEGILLFFKKERLDVGPYGDVASPVKKEVTDMLLQSAYAYSSDDPWGFDLSGGVETLVTTSVGTPLNSTSVAEWLFFRYAAAAPKTRSAPTAAPIEIIEVEAFSWALFSLVTTISFISSPSTESFATFAL
ncbi:hypothetical protein ACHAXH_006271 [Discostella pseudostelligera]